LAKSPKITQFCSFPVRNKIEIRWDDTRGKRTIISRFEGVKNLKYRGKFSYNSRLVSLHPREIVAFPAKRAKIPEIAMDKKKQFSNFS